MVDTNAHQETWVSYSPRKACRSTRIWRSFMGEWLKFIQDEQLYISDPRALQSILVKEQDAYEETAVFVE